MLTDEQIYEIYQNNPNASFLDQAKAVIAKYNEERSRFIPIEKRPHECVEDLNNAYAIFRAELHSANPDPKVFIDKLSKVAVNALALMVSCTEGK